MKFEKWVAFRLKIHRYLQRMGKKKKTNNWLLGGGYGVCGLVIVNIKRETR